MTVEEAIRIETDGRLAVVTMNDPGRLNALGHGMLHGLIESAQALNTHPELQVVVFRGAGNVFTAGADVVVFEAGYEMTREEADAGRLMADAIESIEAVTIAQIHGHCIGGGIVLAAACDLRIAADDTSFSIPEIDLGIPLAWGGIPRMVREIGAARTKELVMTCRPFSAAEALAVGFLNRVVPREELVPAVSNLAEQLLSKPRGPLLATKRQVDTITREMVALDDSEADADALVAARKDPANQAAATAYLEALRNRG